MSYPTIRLYLTMFLTSPFNKELNILVVVVISIIKLTNSYSIYSNNNLKTINYNKPRLSTVDWESYHEHEHEGPGTYAFGYDVQDPATGNTQFREESRDSSGTVRGSYGIVEPDGNVRIVHYVADHLGFRVEIENSLKPDEQHPPQIKPRPVVHRLNSFLKTKLQQEKQQSIIASTIPDFSTTNNIIQI